jgi:hypothetical protein
VELIEFVAVAEYRTFTRAAAQLGNFDRYTRETEDYATLITLGGTPALEYGKGWPAGNLKSINQYPPVGTRVRPPIREIAYHGGIVNGT